MDIGIGYQIKKGEGSWEDTASLETFNELYGLSDTFGVDTGMGWTEGETSGAWLASPSAGVYDYGDGGYTPGDSMMYSYGAGLSWDSYEENGSFENHIRNKTSHLPKLYCPTRKTS